MEKHLLTCPGSAYRLFGMLSVNAVLMCLLMAQSFHASADSVKREKVDFHFSISASCMIERAGIAMAIRQQGTLEWTWPHTTICFQYHLAKSKETQEPFWNKIPDTEK
jgi:hypothetical protein